MEKKAAHKNRMAVVSSSAGDESRSSRTAVGLFKVGGYY